MEQNKVFEEAAVQEAVRGYKVFNPDWTCRHFQYEVGNVFEEDVDPSCCDRGFHFCLKAADCFNYYSYNAMSSVMGNVMKDVINGKITPQDLERLSKQFPNKK